MSRAEHRAIRGFFGIGVYHPKTEQNIGTIALHATTAMSRSSNRSSTWSTRSFPVPARSNRHPIPTRTSGPAMRSRLCRSALKHDTSSKEIQ